MTLVFAGRDMAIAANFKSIGATESDYCEPAS